MRNRLRKFIAIVQLYGTVGLVYFVAGYSSFLYAIGASSNESLVRVNLLAGLFALFLLRERVVAR